MTKIWPNQQQYKNKKILHLAGFLTVMMMFFMTPFANAADELNIYSHRQPFLIKPIISAFENETGIRVNVVYAEKGLVQRLKAEGNHSPADVILTVDIGRLLTYRNNDLLLQISSDILNKNIPPYLRDKNGYWYGVSKRARVIVASKDRVNKDDIKDIEDLTGQKWRGRICTRKGSHVYNRALLASLIAIKGNAPAQEWAEGLVENLARKPQGNDRAQVKAIYQGVCDIALINHYYMNKMQQSDNPEQHEWAKSVFVIYSNQQGRGNHINISGAGVARYSKNPELAIKFLEFLSSQKAQKIYSEVNFEYPVHPALSQKQIFIEDKTSLEEIGNLTKDAQKIIDIVGW